MTDPSPDALPEALTDASSADPAASLPCVTIAYCTQCNWLLRAGWMAQELLSTFGTDLGGVTLIPGVGGIFEIRVDEDLIWERRRDGGFPDVKALKGRVRDRIAPGRDLGHLDRTRGPQGSGAV